MSDPRPPNCRHRLQDEGKAYPRSSCTACGKTVATGLGNYCTQTDAGPTPTRTSDGGPAFPLTHSDTPEHHQGMSLRDYFAGQTMSLLIRLEERHGVFENVTDEKRAERAYQLADAMLAERAK